MDEKQRTQISKFLSLVLRHQPEAAGVVLDDAGWVEVDKLLQGCARAGRPISRAQLEEVVATSPKQRFALSTDGQRIRANQGHSVEVELGYAPATPPATLFHGTHEGVVGAIMGQGLLPMGRHHVHLSGDEHTASVVGARHGKSVVFVVDAAAMHAQGHTFFQSDNGVWLTDRVPVAYLRRR